VFWCTQQTLSEAFRVLRIIQRDIIINVHRFLLKYRVRKNYRMISLRHNLSITHSERNFWNSRIVATAISREKRKPVLGEMAIGKVTHDMLERVWRE
jgi:tRNA A-37 threonylcarbamoyl transferase component Bud32